MAVQYLPRDLVRPSSGLQELAQTVKLVPTDASPAMVLIGKLFQSRLQVGRLKSYGVSPVLFMSRRLWCLLRVVQCLFETWLSNIKSWETAVIIM